VYGIVKQSGGYVAVESERGAGTTFTIYLRRAHDVRAPVEPAPPVAAAAGSARVLVVEDEDVVRGLVRHVLAGDGHDVAVAANADEALALVESGPFDLLLTDLTLPGVDGGALAARLRERDPGLKVVYMSGHADDAVADGHPASVFLQKPFAAGELTRTVRELLAV
jgi:CheY-like chemotaxis protein